MDYRYYTLDVFTDRLFGGNPLAVFPDAGRLSGEQMQRIARELNLSETVFILPERPEGAPDAWRVRIFTPGTELPFAGHPTVGTAFLLASLGRVRPPAGGQEAHLTLHEGVGPVAVRVRFEGARALSAQLAAARPPEERGQPLSPGALEALLNLSPGDVLATGRYMPAAISCGVPFLVVPLRDRAALGRARLDMASWDRLLSRAWAPHLYLVTGLGTAEGPLAARMFAPGMGIPEDPATGAAATALAAYLGAREGRTGGPGVRRWTVSQGVEMGRPSTLHLEAEVDGAGGVGAVRVEGGAVLVGSGAIHVPEYT
jgi:trans-2,3-dihydro-3-hydroxyanthranilate isomerase